MSAAEVRQLLDCPVCYKIVQPPVKFCSVGHVICNVCFTLVSSSEGCPVCRQALLPSSQKNHFVDQLLSRILIPCSNGDKGCREISKMKDMAKHEEVCLYIPIAFFAKESNQEHSVTELFVKHVQREYNCKVRRLLRTYSPKMGNYDLPSNSDGVFRQILFYHHENLCFLFCLYIASAKKKRFNVRVFSFAQINGFKNFFYQFRIDRGREKEFMRHAVCPIFKPELVTLEGLKKCKNAIKFDDVFSDPLKLNSVPIRVQVTGIPVSVEYVFCRIFLLCCVFIFLVVIYKIFGPEVLMIWDWWTAHWYFTVPLALLANYFLNLFERRNRF